MADRWEWALSHARGAPGYSASWCLGYVRHRLQDAQRGTKAYVTWLCGPALEPWDSAAWFWYARPPVGAYVVTFGSLGHGDHHQETVFYADRGTTTVVPAACRAAWERRRNRGARQVA